MDPTSTRPRQAQKVWLIGAQGMLGHALADALASIGSDVVATDRELDIGERSAVLDFAHQQQPEILINAAAYTRVDDAETHEALAMRVNADGPSYLAEAARDLRAPLLHFSTDYVFDGLASSPYTEDAPTGPRSAYGRSKLAGEQRLQDTHPESYIVRTSWLFGEHGANFIATIFGLMQSREELRVVNDQRGRPTYTRDLARAALTLLGLQSPQPSAAASAEPAPQRDAVHRPAKPGIYHFANSGETTWYGLTLAIREACVQLRQELKVRQILPVTTAEFPRPAPRPAYSVLATAKIDAVIGLPEPWPRRVQSYLETLIQRPA